MILIENEWIVEIDVFDVPSVGHDMGYFIFFNNQKVNKLWLLFVIFNMKDLLYFAKIYFLTFLSHFFL